MERYAYFLNCKLLSLPFDYLGIMIGSNHRSMESWKPIVDKFKKKIVGVET